MNAQNISIVKIKDILLVTLPEGLSDRMIDELQERILAAIEQSHARGVILDISLVNVLDSFFARTIAETAQMIGLMSGDTIVAGMRPSVALVATELGLSLGHARTALDVDLAFDMLNENLK